MQSKKNVEPALSESGKAWLKGTQAFMEEFQPVLDEIREHAAGMSHETIEDSAKVVDYTVLRLKKFSEERHAKAGQ